MSPQRKLAKKAGAAKTVVTRPEKRPEKMLALMLTAAELVHVRDLFSVILTTEMSSTVSQALASVGERPLVEAKLWQKVIAACKQRGIAVGDGAPDFVVAASTSPSVNVFEIPSDPIDSELDLRRGGIFGDG